MNEREIYTGFELVSITHVEDIAADVHFFRHRKTGAELIWTGRKDPNKTFCIAFKTIPEDDTGVFHILEHSVLCGSEKYSVKEPFVELLKGSLNTFLNAMTFPDKTIYPVASRNDTDFRNLMRVYLDAVFCPNIYKNENIFLQEGWHYEMDENGEPHYVGVVFGEMTGVYSNVDEVIQLGLLRRLFPDNCYGYAYGGEPSHIPELTYEKFLETHERFYHPSNARIFLDGDVEVESILAEIDCEYLSKYDRRESNFEIMKQNTLAFSESTLQYAVTPDENNSERSHFAMGRIVGDWHNPEKNLAIAVLRDYLTSSNSAPLKRSLLENGLGQDVRFDVESNVAQSFILLQVQNTSEEKLPTIKGNIQQIIRQIIEKGIDRDELVASINHLEFISRERREPYGVQLAITALQSWIYDGDPTMQLAFSKIFSSLREKLNTSYFENLLSEIFLPDDGLVVLHVLPCETLAEENTKKQRQHLNATFENFDKNEQKQIAEKTKALSIWHQTPDSMESLDTIPHLSIKDIPTKPLLTKVSETAINGIKILRPEITSKGTVYLDLYFALPDADAELLSAASLLSSVLPELPTGDHSASSLQKIIKTDLGEVSFGVEVYSEPGQSHQCTPYFRASASVLPSKTEKAISLLSEVLTLAEFDHPDKIDEITRQVCLGQQQNIIMAGHIYAMRHALSGQTAEGYALEQVGGFAYYDWLRKICADFTNAFPSIYTVFDRIRSAFTSKNLTIVVVGDVSDEQIGSLCQFFPEGKIKNTQITVEKLTSVSDAIVIPSGIGYAVKAVDLYRVCDRMTGSMGLMQKLLSLDYLWNEVRVKGGAYGAGLTITPNGSLFTYSFRDPNPARTLDIYSRAAEHLQACCENHYPLEQLIIGAVSDSEPLRSAHEESMAVAARVFRGITEEKKEAERQELLNTTHDDLLICCRILAEAEKISSICVVGSENIVDSCEIRFDHKLSV